MKRLLEQLALIVVLLCLAAPTVSWGTVYDLPAAADAYIGNDHPDTNYGALQYLNMIGWESANLYARIYLRFDLSAIAPGETITDAKLSLYCFNAINRNTNLHYVVGDTWGETTITWNHKPSYAAVLADATPSPSGWIIWDLMEKGNWTPDTDGAVSLLLKFSPESGMTNSARFRSREYTTDPALQPYLEVTTMAIPLPSTVLLLGSGLLGLAGWRLRKCYLK